MIDNVEEMVEKLVCLFFLLFIDMLIDYFGLEEDVVISFGIQMEVVEMYQKEEEEEEEKLENSGSEDVVYEMILILFFDQFIGLLLGVSVGMDDVYYISIVILL